MLGLVTIGQAPRDDVVASMFGGADVGGIIQEGALDLLEPDQIDLLAPGLGELPLVTRLRDGEEVIVAKSRLLPHLAQAVERLEAQGCGTICVLCTGDFPRLGRDALLVFPDRLLAGMIDALLPDGTLGILMPHAGQRESMIAKWTTATRATVTGVASPYSTAGQVSAEIRELDRAGALMVVLDCMGYDRQMLADARAATTRPVILANGVVGGVLGELTGVSVRLFDHVK